MYRPPVCDELTNLGATTEPEIACQAATSGVEDLGVHSGVGEQLPLAIDASAARSDEDHVIFAGRGNPESIADVAPIHHSRLTG